MDGNSLEERVKIEQQRLLEELRQHGASAETDRLLALFADIQADLHKHGHHRELVEAHRTSAAKRSEVKREPVTKKSSAKKAKR